MSSAERKQNHSRISLQLAGLGDGQLFDMVNKAKQLGTGIGGQSVLLTVDGTAIFVKRIALTDLEMQPPFIQSTANYFNLPLHYQYGVGSAGFGAWRELFAHYMTSEWVLEDQCANFPLMYHWRLLPAAQKNTSKSGDTNNAIDESVRHWQSSARVRERLEALAQSSNEIVIFLEYFPENLQQWLVECIKSGYDDTDRAIHIIESKFKETNNFLRIKSFVHFDAHFENILTDGETIYITDFGLALSNSFELSDQAMAFLNDHQDYDRYSQLLYLLRCLIATVKGKEQWQIVLQKYAEGEPADIEQFSPASQKTIKKYAVVAQKMLQFFLDLEKHSKTTPFPTQDLAQLLLHAEKNSPATYG